MTSTSSTTSATTGYRMVKKRHPWRGLFFGLILGLGLGLMAIIYGWYFVGQYTPWLFVVVGMALGLLMAFVPRPWGRKPPPATPPAATQTPSAES